MPVWGFVFVLAAAVLSLLYAFWTKSAHALAFALLCVGLILTFATTSSPVHF